MGGGIEAFTFSISKQLSKLGHNVTVLDRKYSEIEPCTESLDGINIIRLTAIRFSKLGIPICHILNKITFALQAKKYLGGNKEYNIVHLQDGECGFILALINKRLRNKLVYTCHSSRRVSGGSHRVRDSLILALENRLVKWVERVVVPNGMIGRRLVKGVSIKPEKVAVIPHDVDLVMFNPDLEIGDIRQRYGINGKKVVMFVGAINERKGVEYLVEAANIIVDEFGVRDIIFLLVGPTGTFGLKESEETEYLTRILGLIQTYNFVQNVKLTGPVPLDDLRKLYIACDVFVLPTLADLAPRVIPEAMASGRPVVASNVGGIPEMVEDGQSGFLVEPANERQLAEKIKHLIDNPVEAERM